MNVLLVEDEDELRGCIAAALDYQGHEVFEASNGCEAFEILKNQAVGFFDILCTDFNMPFMDGVALIKEAEQKYLKAKSVILFSGRGIDEPAIADLLNKNLSCFIYFIEKPFDLDDFNRALENAAEKAKTLSPIEE